MRILLFPSTVSRAACGSVAGAKVRTRNTQNNAATEVTSNVTGRYFISFLIPGKYVITVEVPGFKQYIRENTDKVTVTAQMSQPETETAPGGRIVDNGLPAVPGTYELPFGKNRTILNQMHLVGNALLGNWRLRWNVTLLGGFPIDFSNAALPEAVAPNSPATRVS